MTPALEVSALSFGYTKNEPVLKDVSFTITRGEFVGIIGPNGGGKTSLLKLLMGFFTPWKGNILLFGKKPTHYPNGVAYVPQALHSDRQFPISVFDLVLEGRLSNLSWLGTFSKEDKEAARHALEQVKLTSFCDRPFGTLSGGQAQRALIARALAQHPEILLLDEPMSYVDAQAEADIYDILNQIQGKITCLMVTHDIRAVIQKVKRVLCVQGTVSSLEPSQICEHFALGLYHFPLQLTSETHLKPKTVFIK